MKIRLLDEQTINEIAAGEVVESAVSIVKECVENSIDANASEIRVEIKAAGRQLIHISDNGCGMQRDDVLLSLERHATSKIRKGSDLETIESMGFRGEALASIAAVSKLRIISSAIEDKEKAIATEVRVEGGKILSVQDAARSQGTSIEIQSLFYNVPVRKKFQASINKELAQIQEQLSSLALAYPFIKFTFVNQGKVSMKELKQSSSLSPLQALKERCKSLLGEDFLKNACPVEAKQGKLKVYGYLSSDRPNQRGQRLIVNHRPIQSREISYAIKEAYGLRLQEGRFPSFVLHIQMPPSELDVNIHPQKKDLRLRKDSSILKFLKDSLNEALCKKAADELNLKEPFQEPKMPVHSFLAEKIERNSSYSLPEVHIIEEAPLPLAYRPFIIGIFKNFILLDGKSLPFEADELYFLDAKRAQERVYFEKYSASLDGKENFPSQNLLFPLTIDLSLSQSKELETQLGHLKKLGFSLELFGKQSFRIDAIPADFFLENTQNFLMDFLEKEEKLALLAAKFSGHKKIDSKEAACLLVKSLLNCKDFLLCPQGQELFNRLSSEEIYKRFKQ